MSAGIASGLFAVLVQLRARGALGGGDVKLTAAMAVGLAPMQTYRFLVATVLAGGVLSLLHIVLRRVPPPERLPGGTAFAAGIAGTPRRHRRTLAHPAQSVAAIRHRHCLRRCVGDADRPGGLTTCRCVWFLSD